MSIFKSEKGQQFPFQIIAFSIELISWVMLKAHRDHQFISIFVKHLLFKQQKDTSKMKSLSLNIMKTQHRNLISSRIGFSVNPLALFGGGYLTYCCQSQHARHKVKLWPSLKTAWRKIKKSICPTPTSHGRHQSQSEIGKAFKKVTY